MNDQPAPSIPPYNPMADLRHRYPQWHVNLTEVPTAPMVTVSSANRVLTLSLCHLDRDFDLTVAVAVALLDQRYGECCTDILQADRLALSRLNRVRCTWGERDSAARIR